MQELDERVVDRCESDFKHQTQLVLNCPLLLEMYNLYSRHVFEHILYQYMHSHYLVVESKENSDGAQDGKVSLGECRSGLLKKRIAGNA